MQMNRFRLTINDSSLQFDRDYGMCKRAGWSIAIKGHFECQLERFFVIAVIKTLKNIIGRYFTIGSKVT